MDPVPSPDAGTADDIAPQQRPVLVVDDSRAQRMIVCRMLKDWGLNPVEADSGGAAMDICRTRQIDLVISDWMMPGMDGPSFCRVFRELKGKSPGYVILLTAKTERERVAEGLEAGADDFLSKPVHPVELRARLRTGQRIIDTQRAITSKNRLLTRALEELRQVYSALDRDLIEARKLQNALVPDRSIQLAGADITLLFRPSGQVGGDLVGVIPVSDTRYGIFSIDVAGHGIASALLVARVAGYLTPQTPEHNIALTHDDDGRLTLRPTEDVCSRLNDVLLNDIESDHYLTMILADCDLATGACRVTQAGHPSPMVQRTGGTIEFPSHYGMPIGLLETAEYTAFDIHLNPGDRLLLFTDGITECADENGTLFEEAGLSLISDRFSDRRGCDFTETLVAHLQSYQGREDFEDDVSAVLIERHLARSER